MSPTIPILFPTRLLTSEDECKWFWHQMIYFPGTINKVSIQLYCHTYIQWTCSLSFSYAHRHSLCACWHSETVKGSSSSSSLRLLISLWVTSSLLLCLELTDAPCHCCGASPLPLPIWRPYPQGPHTSPSQGTRQIPCSGGSYLVRRLPLKSSPSSLPIILLYYFSNAGITTRNAFSRTEVSGKIKP